MSQSTTVVLTMPLETSEFYSGSRGLAEGLGIELWKEVVIKDLNVQTYIRDNLQLFIAALGLTKVKFMLDMIEYYEERYDMRNGTYDYQDDKPAHVLSLTVKRYG